MREKCSRLLHSSFCQLGIPSIFIAIITFLELQMSVSRIPFINSDMSVPVILWNLLSICLIILLFMLAFNKAHTAILVWSILSFGLAFINYYVLLYHGAPLTVHILKNTATALDVIGSYKFYLDKYSGTILFGFMTCIAIVLVLRRLYKSKRIIVSPLKRFCVAIGCIALLCANIYYGVFSEKSFKPQNSIQFSWASSAGKYGFLALQLESHFQENTFSLSFGNYSEDSVIDSYNDIITSQIQIPVVNPYPDIILILNECFYDLEQIVDLEMNAHPLENYYKIDNAIKGYVVASGEGGGTNRSEYELLTSISTSLIPNQTPFLTLDLTNQKSVVSFLEKFGYETYAAHCATSANYNRNYGYPALGFDHSYFELDFEGLEQYGNRDNTDESTYKNLIRWYEEPSDNPKFMYLLTYQNHGGWEQNPEELDTIRVDNNFGAYTSQVNEYLSSLRLSDEELVKLLTYFESVEKPVILCMLGDHGPSFAKNIANPSIPEEDLTYLIKSTPLVIWSNYGLASENIGYISLNYVVPMLLKTVGFPLSPFYQYQVNLMENIPVIMSYRSFYDIHMNRVPYDESKPMTQNVQTYFNMCYGHLKENKFPYIFEPMQ